MSARAAPIRALLQHPRIARWAAVLGLLLTLPALAGGFQLDDHIHRLMLGHGPPEASVPVGRLDLFRFASGAPVAMRDLMRRGAFPYWTLPELRISFLRPLTALTHLLDDALWPERAALMHAQSLLWYALLVLCAGRLYQRLFALGGGGRLAAGLATVCYAVDQSHGWPASWLAQRNGLLAALCAVLCLDCHARWRGEGWRLGAWLAPLWLGVGLLCGEAAVGAVAYLFAFAIVLDPAPYPAWRRLVWTLWPYLLCLLPWRVLYQRLGHGTYGSGFYLDPGREPLLFLRALPARWAVLLGGQLGGLPIDLYTLALPLRGLMLGGAALVLVWLLWASRSLWRRPLCRFLALGAALSVLPCCATAPADRLLLLGGLGGLGLSAELIIAAWEDGAPRRLRGLAAYLLVMHGVLSPLLLPLRSLQPLVGSTPIRRAVARLPPEGAVDRPLVLVNAPEELLVKTLRNQVALEGRPVPALRLLGASLTPVEVERTGAHTLVLRSEGYLQGELAQMQRGPGHPLPLGQAIDLGDWSVTPLALAADGRPREILVWFREALDDPRLRWMVWDGRGLVPFVLPAVGGRVTLSALDVKALLLGP